MSIIDDNNQKALNYSNSTLERKKNNVSSIITFYSFKGGVGRSMVLANLALLFTREYGLNVIAVDWDLEAPGLHRYFNIPDEFIKGGVINYLNQYKNYIDNKPENFSTSDFSILSSLMEIPNSKGKGWYLPPGSLNDPNLYSKLVNEFDWLDFYKNWNGSQVIEYIRVQLKRQCRHSSYR